MIKRILRDQKDPNEQVKIKVHGEKRLVDASSLGRFFGKSVVVAVVVVAVVVVLVVGQTVGSISSKTLAYDCLCTLELCTASMIAPS